VSDLSDMIISEGKARQSQGQGQGRGQGQDKGQDQAPGNGAEPTPDLRRTTP
jgi:hypothetical protein